MAARVPVVVKLFMLEGCSSCPAANTALRELETAQSVPGVEVIALGEHVDYWNRLGWQKPFSAPQFIRYRKASSTPNVNQRPATRHLTFEPKF